MNKSLITLSFLMGVVVLISNFLVQFPIKFFGLRIYDYIEGFSTSITTGGNDRAICWIDFQTNPFAGSTQ